MAISAFKLRKSISGDTLRPYLLVPLYGLDAMYNPRKSIHGDILRPIHWYHSRADLVWPDGSLKGQKREMVFKLNPSYKVRQKESEKF